MRLLLNMNEMNASVSARILSKTVTMTAMMTRMTLRIMTKKEINPKRRPKTARSPTIRKHHLKEHWPWPNGIAKVGKPCPELNSWPSAIVSWETMKNQKRPNARPINKPRTETRWMTMVSLQCPTLPIRRRLAQKKGEEFTTYWKKALPRPPPRIVDARRHRVGAIIIAATRRRDRRNCKTFIGFNARNTRNGLWINCGRNLKRI
mmetsp:Transcript_9650/g.22646  ORF Transcript_9650/g.22646 Transcript_9650/m.22646 type:complete len:205 (-) Transcript_9650:177-791(-)